MGGIQVCGRIHIVLIFTVSPVALIDKTNRASRKINASHDWFNLPCDIPSLFPSLNGQKKRGRLIFVFKVRRPNPAWLLDLLVSAGLAQQLRHLFVTAQVRIF